MSILDRLSKKYLAGMVLILFCVMFFLFNGGVYRLVNLTNPVYNELSTYTWHIWIEYPYYRELDRDDVIAFHKAIQPELDQLRYTVGTFDCKMFATWYMLKARLYFGGDLPVIAVAKVKLLDNYTDPHEMNIIKVRGKWYIIEPQTLQACELSKYPATILEIHFDS